MYIRICIRMFPKIGGETPQNGCFFLEWKTPIKMGMIWGGNTPYFRKDPTQVQPLHLFGPCRRPDVGAALDVPDVPGLAPKGVPSGSAESVVKCGVFWPLGGMAWIGLSHVYMDLRGLKDCFFWGDGIKKVVYKEYIYNIYIFLF